MTTRPTWRDAAGITAIAVVLTVYFSWPLAPRLGSVGRVDGGDGQFSIWNVAWVAHAILTPNVRVFDANIFHPNKGTLAYSEANLGGGLVAVPGYWLTNNPYVAHNSAVIVSFILSVIGMYLLALRLSGSRFGALIASMVFSFCPHVFSHTAHIQLLMIGPFPWVFLALHAFVDRSTWGRVALLGVAIGVQALFCAYYGILTGLLVGACILFYAASRDLWRRPMWWAMVFVAAVTSVAVVLPAFIPYIELQKTTGFGRALDEARMYSATWQDYLASDGWLHEWMFRFFEAPNEVLFPGFVALLAGAAGLFAGLKRARETTVLYVLLAVLAFWSSFGPAAGLYSVLYKVVPVFSLLRAPARFGLAVSFSLAILSAFGLAAVLPAIKRDVLRHAAAAAIFVFTALDLSVKMPFKDVPPVPAAYRTLAGLEGGALAEFPFFYLPSDFHHHARYMLGSTFHWHALVNGYSDYIPPDWAASTTLLASFPNPEGFNILRARKGRYVIFNLKRYTSRAREAVLQRIDAYGDALRPLVKEDDVWLYEIARWPDKHPAVLATPKAP